MTRWWLVLVLSACNQVYGLDETVGPAPLDSDKDGIADEDDNCVLVANVGQANGDDDTFGDDCDPCPTGPQSGIDVDEDGLDDSCDVCALGPNHDEDGDALFDGCDNCPGVANDQADADSDGVGDACDATPADADQRSFFDAFAPPDEQWNTGFSEWVATGEGFTPTKIVTGPSPWNPLGAVSGASWEVTALARLPAAPSDGTTFGISTIDQNGTTALAPYCTIDWVTSRWQSGITGLDITVTDPVRFRLQAVKTAGDSFKATCWINDQPAMLTLTYPASTFFPMLYVTRGAPEYLYIDVVQ